MPQVKGNPTNVVSDIPKTASKLDSSLLNPWGIAIKKNSIWVAVNGSDKLVNYKLDGTLIKTVPLLGSTGPTAIVTNKKVGFNITGALGSGPSQIITVTESGGINGFSSLVDNSAVLASNSPGKVFKGATLADNHLFVTDFFNGMIEKYDSSFNLVSQFTDVDLVNIGYSPFNILKVRGKLYVTYALQDASGSDDVPGQGNGYIDVFDTNGALLKRFADRGPLNSPWGLLAKCIKWDCQDVLALFVGNFGDGTINIYNIKTGKFLNSLKNCCEGPLTIDSLWGLAAHKDCVFFAAGIQNELHGLVGKICDCCRPCKNPCPPPCKSRKKHYSSSDSSDSSSDSNDSDSDSLDSDSDSD